MITTERYSAALHGRGLTRFGVRYRTHLVARWVHGDTLLDVGCADGSMLRELARFAKIAIGIDDDRGFPDALDLDIRRCSAEAIPFEDDYFATVVCSATRKHIRSVMPVMREMARVLAFGGRLIVIDPHPLIVKLGVKFGKFDPRYIRHNDYASQIAEEMRSAGLHVIHQTNGIFIQCVAENRPPCTTAS
jgi:SAM-dependent methyltransferase